MADEAVRILVVDASSVRRQGAAEALRTTGAEVKTAATAGIALNRLDAFGPAVVIVDLETLEPEPEAFLASVRRSTPAHIIAIVPPGTSSSIEPLSRFWATLERSEELSSDEGRLLGQRLCSLLARLRLGKGSRALAGAPLASSAGSHAKAPRRNGPRPGVICIGASTGGPAAIETILSGVGNAEMPGIVVAQHMAQGYIAQLAARLARATGLEVRTGATGVPVRPRTVIMAPDNRHIELVTNPAGYHVELVDLPPIGRFRPSIDVLFHSAARVAADDAIGVILTGMQRDGAQGLKAMHDRGAYTIAQNEATCAVFSMPQAAIALDGVDEVVPLEKICGILLAAARGERVMT